MNEQANIDLVKQCYAAYMAADIEKVLSHMAPDIDWEMAELPGVDFSGNRHGREEVAEFFKQLDTAQLCRNFEPKEFFANGDRVVALGHYDWTIRDSGVEWGSDWGHIFTVKDGLMTSFRELLDTHKIVEAYRQSGAAAVRAPTAGDAIPRPLH
ncbi:nuclear transport factor 2 family protein [Massilia cavernae]|nr:nuclear transport factor 2 family protein [Massilia cavernae]